MCTALPPTHGGCGCPRAAVGADAFRRCVRAAFFRAPRCPVVKLREERREQWVCRNCVRELRWAMLEIEAEAHDNEDGGEEEYGSEEENDGDDEADDDDDEDEDEDEDENEGEDYDGDESEDSDNDDDEVAIVSGDESV